MVREGKGSAMKMAIKQEDCSYPLSQTNTLVIVINSFNSRVSYGYILQKGYGRVSGYLTRKGIGEAIALDASLQLEIIKA
jgi:hypothetical protein